MKRFLVPLAALSMLACSAAAPDSRGSAPPQEMTITSKSAEAIEHFKQGRDLSDNQRVVDAVTEFDRALALDSDFALAMAYRGLLVPMAVAREQLNEAVAKSSSLPNAERFVVEAMVAARQGDIGKSQRSWAQAAEAAPGDWHVQFERGNFLYSSENYAEALDAFDKATHINPNAGPVFNGIGYAHLVVGESEKAAAAFRRYADLAPSEPNAHDSLGEALLADGKFAESEAAFRSALRVAPTFFTAWDGIAYTKFYSGDWAAGEEATGKAGENTRPRDRDAAGRLGVVALLAEGKTGDAIRQIAAIESSSSRLPYYVALAILDRGTAMLEAGRRRDALADAAKVVAMVDAGKIEGSARFDARRTALTLQAAAQGFSGDAVGADRTAAALGGAANDRKDDASMASAVHFSEAMAAVARKDLNGAVAHFDRCSNQDVFCQWQAFEVSQKAGDAGGAAAARNRLTKIYRRDPIALWARTVVERTAPKTK